MTHYANGTEIVGCPSTQEWCRYTPRWTIFQLLALYILTCVGYPLGVTLIQTIFSKVLGPRPQGVWMGLLEGAGCLSRVTGPVFVGHIYARYGIYHTFGVTSFMLVASMLWLFCINKHLVVNPSTGSNDTKNTNEVKKLNETEDENEKNVFVFESEEYIRGRYVKDIEMENFQTSVAV